MTTNQPTITGRVMLDSDQIATLANLVGDTIDMLEDSDMPADIADVVALRGILPVLEHESLRCQAELAGALDTDLMTTDGLKLFLAMRSTSPAVVLAARVEIDGQLTGAALRAFVTQARG